jgi:excisionase family DNA binding protein
MKPVAARNAEPIQAPLDPLSAAIRAVVATEIDRLRDELAEIVAARPAKKLLDSNELCQMLGVTQPLIRRMRDEGMPFVRVGEVFRYDGDAVLAWLAERTSREAGTS